MKAGDLNGLLIREAHQEDYTRVLDFLLESSNLYPEIES
jgi:hypothetical protein